MVKQCLTRECIVLVLFAYTFPYWKLWLTMSHEAMYCLGVVCMYISMLEVVTHNVSRGNILSWCCLHVHFHTGSCDSQCLTRKYIVLVLFACTFPCWKLWLTMSHEGISCLGGVCMYISKLEVVTHNVSRGNILSWCCLHVHFHIGSCDSQCLTREYIVLVLFACTFPYWKLWLTMSHEGIYCLGVVCMYISILEVVTHNVSRGNTLSWCCLRVHFHIGSCDSQCLTREYIVLLLFACTFPYWKLWLTMSHEGIYCLGVVCMYISILEVVTHNDSWGNILSWCCLHVHLHIESCDSQCLTRKCIVLVLFACTFPYWKLWLTMSHEGIYCLAVVCMYISILKVVTHNVSRGNVLSWCCLHVHFHIGSCDSQCLTRECIVLVLFACKFPYWKLWLTMSHEGTYCLGVVCMYISILKVVTHNVSRGNVLSWCCLHVHFHIGSCDSQCLTREYIVLVLFACTFPYWKLWLTMSHEGMFCLGVVCVYISILEVVTQNVSRGNILSWCCLHVHFHIGSCDSQCLTREYIVLVLFACTFPCWKLWLTMSHEEIYCPGVVCMYISILEVVTHNVSRGNILPWCCLRVHFHIGSCDSQCLTREYIVLVLFACTFPYWKLWLTMSHEGIHCLGVVCMYISILEVVTHNVSRGNILSCCCLHVHFHIGSCDSQCLTREHIVLVLFACTFPYWKLWLTMSHEGTYCLGVVCVYISILEVVTHNVSRGNILSWCCLHVHFHIESCDSQCLTRECIVLVLFACTFPYWKLWLTMSHEGIYCLGVVCMYISILEVVTHNVSRGNILSWCCLHVHFHIGSCDSQCLTREHIVLVLFACTFPYWKLWLTMSHEGIHCLGVVCVYISILEVVTHNVSRGNILSCCCLHVHFHIGSCDSQCLTREYIVLVLFACTFPYWKLWLTMSHEGIHCLGIVCVYISILEVVTHNVSRGNILSWCCLHVHFHIGSCDSQCLTREYIVLVLFACTFPYWKLWLTMSHEGTYCLGVVCVYISILEVVTHNVSRGNILSWCCLQVHFHVWSCDSQCLTRKYIVLVLFACTFPYWKLWLTMSHEGIYCLGVVCVYISILEVVTHNVSRGNILSWCCLRVHFHIGSCDSQCLTREYIVLVLFACTFPYWKLWLTMSHEGTYCLGVVCMYISILEVVTHNVSRGNILSWCCLHVHLHIGSCDSHTREHIVLVLFACTFPYWKLWLTMSHEGTYCLGVVCVYITILEVVTQKWKVKATIKKKTLRKKSKALQKFCKNATTEIQMEPNGTWIRSKDAGSGWNSRLRKNTIYNVV